MIKACKICGREFECYEKNKAGRGARFQPKKPYTTICCSKKCSNTNTDLLRKKRRERMRLLKNGK